MSEFDLLMLKDGKLCVKQATKKGYIELSDQTPVVCDLSYPNSKTRRGRVQGGGLQRNSAPFPSMVVIFR